MHCPKCGTETEEFNGGQMCWECGEYIVPPSPIDARVVPEFRTAIKPYVGKISCIPDRSSKDLLFTLISYYSEYVYSVGQSGYVPARTLGAGAYLNSMRWIEIAPDVMQATVDVSRLFLSYASERDSKYLDAAVRLAASTLRRLELPVLRDLESNIF